MPVLLPGILELSRRGRYFSFHAFLLAEYQARRMPESSKSLWAFIKRREWELGLAVLRCPKECGSSPVGARRLGRRAEGPGPFARGESVDSDLGGYGLYYRSPLAELGIVAKAGTLLGNQPIPLDVLYDTDRARRLAAAFKSAIEGTAYYQRAMWTDEDLSAEVIDEYAKVGCLCGLRERRAELAAVHDALFGSDPPAAGAPGDASGTQAADEEIPTAVAREGTVQRRRTVAHYLTLVEADPQVVTSDSAYREALWSATTPRSNGHAVVAGQWAAVIAKDVWQESICSVWSEFCRAGLDRTRGMGRGLTWDETRATAGAMTDGPPALNPQLPTRVLADQLAAGTLTIPAGDGAEIDVSTATLEELRQATVQLDTAASGLVVLLELTRRMERQSGAGWTHASRIASGWQPSVAAVAGGLRAHLADDPVVVDTLWWLVSSFVLPVHERIAYSKLPEYTFRFRWEDGLLRFYDHGTGRFPLAGIRGEPLSSLTRDLGLWEQASGPGDAVLTSRGTAFVNEAFA
jgi:hypothetical protein